MHHPGQNTFCCSRRRGAPSPPRGRSPATQRPTYSTPRPNPLMSPSPSPYPPSRPASAVSYHQQPSPSSWQIPPPTEAQAGLAGARAGAGAGAGAGQGAGAGAYISRVRLRDEDQSAAAGQPSKRPRASKWDQQESEVAAPAELPQVQCCMHESFVNCSHPTRHTAEPQDSSPMLRASES